MALTENTHEQTPLELANLLKSEDITLKQSLNIWQTLTPEEREAARQASEQAELSVFVSDFSRAALVSVVGPQTYEDLYLLQRMATYTLRQVVGWIHEYGTDEQKLEVITSSLAAIKVRDLAFDPDKANQVDDLVAHLEEKYAATQQDS